MSIYQVLGILWARKWVTLAAVIGSLFVAGSITQILPRQYEASTQLLLDVGEPDPVTGKVSPGGMMRSYSRTQIALIKSERVASLVVDRLRLTQSEQYLNAFSSSNIQNGGDIRRWIGGQLLDNLNVQIVGGSNILEVTFASTSPQFAAQVANAFTDAYLQVDLELRVDPANRNAQWFDAELNNLEQALESSQRKLTSYQQRTGLLSVAGATDTDNTEIEELTTRLANARAEASEARTIIQQLEAYDRTSSSATSLPEELGNSAVLRWRDELASIDAQMASLSSSYGENHPAYKSLVSRREVVHDQLAREVREYRRSVLSNVSVLDAKSASLEVDLEKQKQAFLQDRQDRDALQALQAEVAIRRAEFQNAFRRTSELKLEGRLAQTSVAVMSEAVPPQSHSFPRVQLTLILAGGFGFILGVGLSFIFEMFDRRVRSHRDLGQIAEAPVLAFIGKSRKKGFLRRRFKQKGAGVPMSLNLQVEAS